MSCLKYFTFSGCGWIFPVVDWWLLIKIAYNLQFSFKNMWSYLQCEWCVFTCQSVFFSSVQNAFPDIWQEKPEIHINNAFGHCHNSPCCIWKILPKVSKIILILFYFQDTLEFTGKNYFALFFLLTQKFHLHGFTRYSSLFHYLNLIQTILQSSNINPFILVLSYCLYGTMEIFFQT